jgi:hypothetical protein
VPYAKHIIDMQQIFMEGMSNFFPRKEQKLVPGSN